MVNLYDAPPAAAALAGAGGGLFAAPVAARPAATIMNLTTRVDRLVFDPSGAILAAASTAGKDALRLVHTASGTVFANWPAARTPLGTLSALAFSPRSGYFAAGNEKGKVLLYRLNHFSEI